MAQKTLIAYYSLSGNTKSVAEKIKEITNGDLFEIKTIKEYPRNYNDVVNLAKEEKEKNYMPELSEDCDLSEYDTIFIGSPVWWYTFASPVRTFLTKNDFTGKTILPFCTHGGGGASSTYTDIKALCPTADVKEGFTSYADNATVEEIKKWIK